jgi:iron complex outermembrane receptor protein
MLTKRLLGSVTALFALVSGVRADEDRLKTMDKVVVVGERETSKSTGATRTDTPLIETPQSITVISAEQITDQNAQNMQAVLRYAPGVRAEMYGLDNRGDWFTLRGGSEGSTLLDGLRVPLTGWYGVVRNEPFGYERVEVLRGPSSVVAGQNGPGGVVNLVSKRPQEESRREIGMQFGDGDHRQFTADWTGALSGDGAWLYRFVGLARESGTQVQFADEERVYIAPSIAWHPTENTSLTIYGQYQDEESGNTEGFFPWAGTLYAAPNGFIPMDRFVGEPDWDSYGGTRLRFGYELEQQLGENWSLQHRVRYDDIDGHLRSMYANFWEVDADGNGYGANAAGANRTIGRTWYITENEGRVWNTDVYVTGRAGTENVEHTLLFGVDALRNKDSAADLGGDATPLDVYTPEYGTFPLPTLDFGPAVTNETKQYGVLIQDQMKIRDKFIVVGSMRFDKARSTGVDDSELTKRVGFVYLGKHGLAPYLSYSESFEPVSGTDAQDEPFVPKRGNQVEVGLRWQPEESGLTFSAAAYRLVEENRLSTDPDNPLFSVQLGEVTVDGLELEANATLANWNLVAGYTYSDARQTDSSDPADPYLDKQLASIPEHSASVWAVHRFERAGIAGLRIGAGVRYVGRTWDGADTLSVPSNTLVDALVSYDFGSWRLALNANNLLDESYLATCLERGDCWYGTRREIVGSATFSW